MMAYNKSADLFRAFLELFHPTTVLPVMDTRRLLKQCASTLLALGMAAVSLAQANGHDQAVLPVVNADNGQIQAWLVLEPDQQNLSISPARSNPALGERFGLSIGAQRGPLPLWLTRNNANARATPGGIDVNDLTVFARKAVGTDTYLSLAGTVTRATLVPYAAAAPADIGRAWNSKSLAVGGGYGAFSANLIGQMVDSPGQPRWENLGLGVTWRTPWSGQLTVGADNIVTSGRNPFSPRGETRDEGTVPYVRYEQDFE